MAASYAFCRTKRCSDIFSWTSDSDSPRHVALVLQVRARQDRGESLSEVQEKISEHRFVLQKAYDAAKDADPEQLEAALRAIRDYEWEVKSGQVDAELGLDVLLARL